MRVTARRKLSLVFSVAALLCLLAVRMPQHAAAASPPTTTCSGETSSIVCDARAAAQSQSAEEQLAAKFVPIAYLKQQSQACDTDGEPYLPAPVEVVLGDPAVVLRQDTGGDSAAEDPIIVTGPNAQDLVGRDDTYYLDFPGNPRNAGCDYEQWFKQRMTGLSPTTYAHIATDPEQPGKLALQYWFYYVFNDFNNTHESDWEMIQLTFDAGSAEEALTQEPVQLAYAQHGGAESASWNDEKVLKEGDHVIVYPAAGSHATQYGSHTYIGWGENGTGFGCDHTNGPSVRTELQPVLMPGNPDPNGPFAWLLFNGRWGEKQPWEFNGPKGPNLGTKWTSPVSWTDNIRDSSLKVPTRESFGPSPTSAFCTLSTAGSQVLIYFGVYPKLIKIGLLALLSLCVVLFFISRRYFGPTWHVYRRHRRTFGLIGLIAIPIGVIINGLEYLVSNSAPVEWALSWLGDSPVSRLTLALMAALVQQLLMIAIVGPGVIQAMKDAQAGIEPSVRRSYQVVFSKLGQLVRAVIRSTAIIAALNISIIGIPWAIWNFVRWGFFGQAVIVDRAPSGHTALNTSANAVKGAWWRTLGIGAVFTLIGAAPGPLIGIILLIFASASVQFANGLSSIIYAFTVPFSLIGATLLYEHLRDRFPRKAPEVAKITSPS